MSSGPKTVPKKLNKGPTIAVDTQILRWRQRLKKEGIILGKKTAKQDEINRRIRQEREVDTDEKLIASFKKKFGNG